MRNLLLHFSTASFFLPSYSPPLFLSLHPFLLLDEADRDGDGLINEEEFVRIMKKSSLF